MSAQPCYNIAEDAASRPAHDPHLAHHLALISIQQAENALVCQKLSFFELEQLANRAANLFRSFSFPPGSRIVLRLPNIPEFPISFLGAIKAGYLPVPTSLLLTQSELEFILNDSKASLLVLQEEDLLIQRDWKPPESLRLIEVSPSQTKQGLLESWSSLLEKASPVFEKISPTLGSSPAYWLYTSGTTGRPKAVIHAHQSIPAHDARVKIWQDLKPDDVVFNTSALNWSYALTAGMLDVWRHGATALIYSGELTAKALRRVIEEFGVTLLMSVPGIYRRLLHSLEGRKTKLGKVRLCLSAGEKISESIRTSFEGLTGIPLREGLGMTEHSIYLVQEAHKPSIPGSCGRSLSGQRIAILREDLTETSPYETGMLASHRSCEGLMLGYYQRPEEEEKVFRGEWFLSGDFAYRDEQGNFFFAGRRDDLISAGGYRVSPLEVEAVLNQHPAVSESAVTGEEIEPGKTLIMAFVVLNPQPLSEQEVRHSLFEFLSQHLALYKQPRHILFVHKLPKTSQGKVQRALLRKNSLEKRA